MQESSKNNLKIHIHLFYTNHLGEHAGYEKSERFNIDSVLEKWHKLHQKRWTESPMNTDKDS